MIFYTESMMSDILFNDDWKFLKTDIKATYEEVGGFLPLFKSVALPHDWLIENSKDLYETSAGWYIKEFEIKEKAAHSFLYFYGVYMDSEVFVNDVCVGEWKYGYSSFCFEITEALKKGTNTVIVHVRHENPNSRWYSGAGIFRDVHYIEKGRNYLTLNGTYVHNEPVQNGDFMLHFETEVVRDQEEPDKELKLTYSLTDPFGKSTKLGSTCGPMVGAFEFYRDRYERILKEIPYEKNDHYKEPCFDLEIPADEVVYSGSFNVEKPILWDICDPKLYRLKVTLSEKDRKTGIVTVLDTDEFDIGFKTVVFDNEKGFFLNGRNIKLNGVCEHHDLGALGSAFSAEAFERQLKKLKKMGVNALRTSHNMPDPHVMELCDRMGILVDNEAFDMWEMPMTKYDYARFFCDWSYKDVASWIRRDRNHVSNIMWSIGNEIPDTVNGENGVTITKHLYSNVLLHDPMINSHATIGSNFMEWEKAQNCSSVLKIAGYNYGERLYQKQHEEHPEWVIYGSETASLVTSRGIYHFPLSEDIMSDEDGQCSALGNSFSSWGAKSIESCIYIDRDTEFSLGQFLWSGFDYIGEPTPYNSKNSFFGQIDTAGFPKDSYYCFKAEWNRSASPFVHLFPYWDFNEGQIIDVRAASNCAAVELFVNGRSLGKKEIDHEHGTELIPTWQVPYEKGNITAVAYDAEGNECARDRRSSFKDTVRPVLSVEDNAVYSSKKPSGEGMAEISITPDGRELYFVCVSAADEDGMIVENAVDTVKLTVSGGELAGLDNGDSTDYDQYKGDTRKLFSGKLLAIVRAESKENIVVKAELISSTETNVNVRKVELSPERPLALCPEDKEAVVEARIYPANASDKGIIWKVVNVKGIDLDSIGITDITTNEEREKGVARVKLTGLGDGKGYLRALSKSGTENVRIISQTEVSAEGFGEMRKNPYKFLSCGLYDSEFGRIGPGNDKGISTFENNRSGAVYRDIDFGSFGSDEVTFWMFTFSGNVYELELYEGDATEEGQGRLIEVLKYQQPSTWNVYKPQTFKLPERLKGVKTLTLVAHCRMHVKGFEFTKQEKAYSWLNASDNDHIAGDSFELSGASVKNIGNNVFITYDDMDFGNEMKGVLHLHGSTTLESTTVRLMFTSLNGEEHVQSFEVRGGASEHEIKIEKLVGKGKVQFIFLPGTKFDLDGFRFE
jgi:beta-galactosidase